ncbi:MAG: sulfatase, partial [Planctomycetota bacterium]
NYPVCNVSRTSVLSGRYPEATGVFNNSTSPRSVLGDSFQFLPEYFRAQGYFTAGAGKIAHGSYARLLKWDYVSEPSRGVVAEDDDAPPKRPAGKKAKTKAKSPAQAASGDPFEWQATANDDADEPDGQTARRLRRFFAGQPGQPFFIAAGFHKPHVPHTAPKKYFDLHDPAKMPTPPEPPGHVQQIPKIAFGPGPKYLPDLTVAQRRQVIQHSYAATSFMDAQVGVLLAELDRFQLWDSTVVVFMSDHGWHLGEHGGLYAKMSVFDESARVPLIVVAPGAKAGSSSTALVEYVDLFPTLVELCGLPVPAGLQGVSFAPLLRDPAQAGKESVYTVVNRRPGHLGRGLYTRDFRYFEWPDGSQQLYHAAADPHEYVNLAPNPAYAETLTAMKAALARRRAALQPAP